ncbi:DNA-processing protein DprA [Aquibacillus sp. 3ASR75-11]|uniref:DNA-processing protein DprA n=1 Tax=Terrihalobacillus insolitus TaxID=2950438 RepID=A0A9X3WPU1_9BACI|nr:DNA-processing protein DprA [Terrihalobacillus insolitus]MDC3414148.1 DNA-processing protein DprA [Terrihalobacillus insolitus]MDC3423590.1 DNA-processing protein DprA [Terrihalobacillus insolitus]
MNKRIRLIHLHRARGATRPLIRRILKKDPTLEHLYHWPISSFTHNFSLPSSRATQLYQDLHDKQLLSTIFQDMKTYKIITLFDEQYPKILRTIIDPPFVLYATGDVSILQSHPSLSVVGTRNPTKEAMQKMTFLLKPLIEYGFTIVSGMAMGIDGLAHRITMSYSGRTIAVLGGGFEHIYPKGHQGLFQQLASTQLVLSEYAPHVPPQKFHFPERNRIISGLSFGTLVVEAKDKSGSLITVDQALEQGREAYAVPGSILSPQSSGCHKMILDGAKLVQNTHEIISDWNDLQDKWSRILSDNEENDALFMT